MKFVSIRDLKINGSKVIDSLGEQDAIVTRNGKPIAALVPIDEDTIEEFIIARNPKLLRELADAKSEYKRKGGKDLATIKKELKKRSG